MKKNLPYLVAATALWLGGCQTEPNSLLPRESTKYSIESTGKFALLDQPAQTAVTCSGLQERVNAEGRLEVVANVQNRGRSRLEVQVRCVFKDRNGFSTGDETPWQTLVLEDSATEAVRFAAANNLAQKFTVAVRQAHGTEPLRLSWTQ